tara:strand:+ start:1217 stop:1444 length:228 start_codon:yes stop_codon:yes gene_type:complete
MGKNLKRNFIMAKTSPAKFVQEVKSEARKVTWPAKKEMIASTIAVFIMVIIAALFLYLSDQVIAFFVSFILGFGA